jgi:ABC-type multidrug transport system fused ATPase/permease subunit
MTRVPAIFANGRRRRIACVAGLALGQAAAAGLAAFATRDAFAALHGGAGAPIAALTAIAFSGCLIAGLRVAERTVAERLGGAYVAEVREKLFLRTARTPPRALARRRRGGLALRFVGDMAALRGWVALGLPRLISAAITMPATALVLALLDPRLALAAAAPLLVALAALAALGRSLARAHRCERRLRARIASEMTEQMAHGAALRLVGRVGAIRARLRAQSRELIAASAVRARLAGVARAIPDAAAGLAACAMLAAAFGNGVTPATTAGALAALGLAVHPLRRLAEAHDRRQAWRVARDKLERALSADALPARGARRRAPLPEAPALSFDMARLASGRRVSAALARGEVGLLRGLSCADGTGLLLTAAGLEPLREGRVTAFGRAPDALPTGVIAYVGPSAPLVRGSILRNLTLGLRRPSEDAQRHALRAAGLEALAARPDGLDARLAENGAGLGAVERGRLRLARALLARPDLLLVDSEDLGLDQTLLERLFEEVRATGASLLISLGRDIAIGGADCSLSPAADGVLRREIGDDCLRASVTGGRGGVHALPPAGRAASPTAPMVSSPAMWR